MCFGWIDAGAKVVYTGYRQTGESPEVVAGRRKPERGLKLRFVFVKKLKQKGPEFPALFVCYFSVFSSSGALFFMVVGLRVARLSVALRAGLRDVGNRVFAGIVAGVAHPAHDDIGDIARAIVAAGVLALPARVDVNRGARAVRVDACFARADRPVSVDVDPGRARDGEDFF